MSDQLPTLKELYANHRGKVSDKWEIYIAEYDRLFQPYRDQPVSVLEIGIQNGGSLEIWNKFFANTQKIVGCDINPSCAQLQFDDPRIAVIVCDANTTEAEQQILAQAGKFDLIIDDGSHQSSDIVRSFSRYFPHLNDGGVYIAEDLHCSYWKDFDGGIFQPYSPIAFFKRLADTVNHEHWGVETSRSELLESFNRKYELCLQEEVLAHIHSIEFVNSLCIIRKENPEKNILGLRHIAGEQALVWEGALQLHGSSNATRDQSENYWAKREAPVEEALMATADELSAFRKLLMDRDKERDHTTQASLAREVAHQAERDLARQQIEAQLLQLAEREKAASDQLHQLRQLHDQQISQHTQAHADREQVHQTALDAARQNLETHLLQLAEREKSFAEQHHQLRQLHGQERSAQNQVQAEREQAHQAELGLARQKIEAQLLQLVEREKVSAEQLRQQRQLHDQQISQHTQTLTDREQVHKAALDVARQSLEAHLLQLAEREKGFAEQHHQLQQLHGQERSARNQIQADREQAHQAELALARQKIEAHVLQFRSQKEVLETRFAHEKNQVSAQLANLSRNEKLNRDLSSELELKLKAQEKVSVFAVEEQERARAKFAKDLHQEKLLLQTEIAKKQRILQAQADFLQRANERDLKDARVRHERREGQLNTQLTTAQKNLDRANSELAAQHQSFAGILSRSSEDHRNYLEEIRRPHRQAEAELLALKNSAAEAAKNFQQVFADRQAVFEQHILERELAAEGFKADASARLMAQQENLRHINLLLSAEQAWHEKAAFSFSEFKMRYESECEQILADFEAVAAIPWWRVTRKAREAQIAFRKHSLRLPALEFSVFEHNSKTSTATTRSDALHKSETLTTQRSVENGSVPSERTMSIQHITAHKGSQFIRVAYLQILGREPDTEGEKYYSQRLKNGVPKIEILAQLRMSAEGKKFKTKLLGINEVIAEHKWMKIPVIGVFIKNRMKFNSDINSRFEGLDERIGILNQKMGVEFAELHRVIQLGFAELSGRGIPTNNAELSGVFPEMETVALEASKSIEIPNYFDSIWYTTQYPELDLQGLSSYSHFLKYGAELGCHPAFDADWYKSEYPDVANAEVDPYEHFLSNGKSEGRHPAFDTKWYLEQYGDEVEGDAYAHYVSKGREEGNYPAFDRSWYLAQYKDVASNKMDPYEHYSKYGRTEGRRPAYNPMDKPQYESRTKDFPVAYASEYQAEQNFDNLTTDIKAVTFFLPQFHRCDQNDRWWGEGFTEWTNTKSSKPNFPGHYQPREPHADIGYYDLSDVETLRKQAALAKAHGIHGFCFYHYWFSGDRILEKPVDLLIENKDIDIKFMLCWANENWTKTWDGQESNILLEQKYLPDDPIKFISDISRYVKDSRYICVNGKPVIMVYKPQVIPRVKEVFQIWRSWWRENIGGEILIWCNRTNFEDTAVKSLADAVDAIVEFPPHVVQYEIDQTKIGFDTNGHFFDYQHFAADIQNGSERTNNPAIKFYRSVMLGWDNSARRKKGWSVWYGFSLQVYYDWLKHTIKYTRETFDKDERFVFVNAWNEWAEGTYLEPDVKSGYASINTTSKALFDLPFKEAATVLKPLAPEAAAPGKIAVHAHLYFEDVAKEMMNYLNRIPYPFDLFITTDTKAKVDKFSKLFKSGGRQRNLAVTRTPNIGRDIAPLMVEMSKKLAAYDFIGHFHTKKSTTVNWGDQWRHYLLNNLLGSKEIIAGIFAKFSVDPKLGLMFPQNYPLIAPYADWGGLNVECEKLLKDVGIDYSLPGRPDFPAGNMFWGRTAALKPLFDRKWSYDDFEPEEGQVGKTMAHAIERVWKYVAAGKNFSTTEFFAVQPNLAVPSAKKRLSFFVHHEASGQISDADMYYLTQLKAISADVVFISNSDLSAAQLKRVEPLAYKIVSRKNVGFDFGAWRDALNAVGWDRAGTYDEIVFANNSCFGPVFPMGNMFSTMQKSGANFWAITDFPDSPQSLRAEAVVLKNNHIPAHLQSYFMVFDRKVVASSEFRDFWSSVIDVTDILDVIAIYETQLTGILLRCGFKCGSYINEAGIIQGRNTHIPEFNTAYSDPISMIALGSPFIKKKISIYSAPRISEVKELVEGFGHYPSELLVFPSQKKVDV